MLSSVFPSVWTQLPFSHLRARSLNKLGGGCDQLYSLWADTGRRKIRYIRYLGETLVQEHWKSFQQPISVDCPWLAHRCWSSAAKLLSGKTVARGCRKSKRVSKCAHVEDYSVSLRQGNMMVSSASKTEMTPLLILENTNDIGFV